MIKIITIITKFVVATLIALFFTSCNFSINTVKGSGTITKEERVITADFKSIEVHRGIEVIIEQSDKVAITVETDKNLQKHITTKIENGVLKIDADTNFDSEDSPKVTVKMPVIESLQASSGSEIKSENTLKGESILLDTSSAGEINVNLEFDTISSISSSGSSITIVGKALKFESNSSSGSETDANELLVNDVTANASSGAFIGAHPIVSLGATASSGAEIRYNIDPKSITKSESSGGSVERE
jgi:Putative auto-transporter adhesin, head GIN domain